MKNSFHFLAILPLLVSLSILPRAYADVVYDLEVTCPADNSSTNPCTKNTEQPLFDEKNWYPGSTATKIIRITNQDKNNDCPLKVTTSDTTQSPATFSTQLLTTITEDGKNIFNNTLQNFFDSTTKSNQIEFSDIPNNSSRDYVWTITFDRNAGNDFQNANVKFDFDLNFTCDDSYRNTFGEDTRNTGRRSGSQGVVAGINTFIQNIFNPQGGQVEINPTPEEPTLPKTEKPKEKPAAVEGASTESPNKCTPLSWWWLLFILQFVILLVIKYLFGKKQKVLGTVFQLLLTSIFAFVFWKYFCSNWDEWFSILMGLFWMFLPYKK